MPAFYAKFCDRKFRLIYSLKILKGVGNTGPNAPFHTYSLQYISLFYYNCVGPISIKWVCCSGIFILPEKKSGDFTPRTFRPIGDKDKEPPIQ
jgi:hypothetical protein